MAACFLMQSVCLYLSLFFEYSKRISLCDWVLGHCIICWFGSVSWHNAFVLYLALTGLGQWFLTCGKFPTGGEWQSCQVGNDRSDSRTTASKFNTSHPNVDW